MQLCQPKPFGMLDHHHRRIPHIHPDFDHGRRHENLNRPGLEGRHGTFFLSGLQPSMEQSDPSLRKDVALQVFHPWIAALRSTFSDSSTNG